MFEVAPAPIARDGTDVIVIGGGHNGLVAAAYVARAGLSVTVLEALPTIGGMARTEYPIAGAPDHAVHPCAVDLIFIHASNVIQELQLTEAGLEQVIVDPSYVYLDPDGGSVAFWRDPRRTAAEIRRFSPADADTYLDLVRTLDGLLRIGLPLLTTNPVRPAPTAIRGVTVAAARSARRLPDGMRILGRSPLDTLNARFRHPVVRDALAALIAAGGPLTKRATGATLMYLAFLHGVGVTRPIGGMQAFSDALVRRVESAGSTVLTNAKVEQILTRGGRASGVRLSTGEVLQAHVGVIGACHPQVTLGSLLPEGTLSPRLAHRVRAIPTSGDGTGDLKVDIALDGRLRLRRHEKWRGDGLDLRVPAVMVGQVGQLNNAWAVARGGAIPDTLPFWGFVGTATDPSQAPPGQDVLYLWTPFVPLRPALAPDEFKRRAGDALVATAATFYDGITTQEIGRVVAGSADIAAKYQVPNGCIEHVDLVLGRMGPLRPARGLGAYRTPVRGLYLSGNGTHPGLGVSGIPGQLAARELLRTVHSGHRTNWSAATGSFTSG